MASMGRGKWPNSRLKEAPPNQKKITQFFKKAGEPAPPPTPRASSSRPRYLITPSKGVVLMSPAKEPVYDNLDDVEVLTPPLKPPAEVIVLSDGEYDAGEETTETMAKVKEEPGVGREEEPEVQVVEVPENVVESPLPPPQPQPQQQDEVEVLILDEGGGDGFGDDSSGDEILSQLDIDEIVRSSQSQSSQDSLADLSYSPSLLTKDPRDELVSPPPPEEPGTSSSTTPPTPRRVPKRSPRSQVNKFSPHRHMQRKRNSSQASLDKFSPTRIPARNGNGSPVEKNGSPKKRLQFQDSGAWGEGRYYIRNFMTILDEVIKDPFHFHLIDEEDRSLVEKFMVLSLLARSLYVRLFQRKWGWKPLNKLNNNYKELPTDLSGLIRELTDCDPSNPLLEGISSSNSTLEEVLDTLDLVKMGNLAKGMRVGGKKTKEGMKKELLLRAKNQPTLAGASGTAAILKAALNELGPAYRISLQSKTLFSRLFLLYSPPHYWEVESDQASNQLLILLLNSTGQMEYPEYEISKTQSVYKDRSDLLRFHDAFTLHSNLVALSKAKQWSEVVELAKEALNSFQTLLEDQERLKEATELPKFLRIYTEGSALCHACWMGVDGFQKQKQFTEANQLLRTLLGQTTFLPNYRGRLWERLAINAGHLKESKEGIGKLLEEALGDPALQENHKLILSQRLEKNRQSMETAARRKKPPKKGKKGKKKAKKGEKESSDTDFEEEETQLVLPDEEVIVPDLYRLKHEVPTRTISGEKMDRGPRSMGKSYFIGKKDASGSNRISSVEQHAIQFYLGDEGSSFTAGIHGEGSTVVSLYGLLFWDVIFDDGVADAFHTKYQAYPLDMHFDDFYLRRKDKIEEKLELIRSILSVDDLIALVEQVWGQNEKKLSIVSWGLFEGNFEGLAGLMRALGTKVIAKLCERLARNLRYYSSGFPDVVVWGEEEGKVMFVEVKGPGDSLSAKQQLWLDWLVEEGIPAEVCYVKAVSNKRIRLDG